MGAEGRGSMMGRGVGGGGSEWTRWKGVGWVGRLI